MVLSQFKIVFLGTPAFAVPTLKALIKNDLKPFLVITQPDQPVGRKKQLTPPPVKEQALAYNLVVLQPEDKKDLKRIFIDNDCDLAILVAYGLIIPQSILAKPKFGFLNLHPSLLPKYRGPTPIQTVLLNGEKETGVTLIQLTNQVDAGPMIAQKIVAIDPADNSKTLSDKLAQAAAALLLENLADFLAGVIKPITQDEKQATSTRVLQRQDGQLDWQKSALTIDRQFRAFYPWPGVFTHLDGKRLKIVNLSVLEGNFRPNLMVGEVFLGPDNTLAVKASQGAVLLKTVQFEGKKAMTGKEFLRGRKDLVGKILK